MEVHIRIGNKKYDAWASIEPMLQKHGSSALVINKSVEFLANTDRFGSSTTF